MVSSLLPLEQIHIASPCSAKWSDMEGDDKVRFCGECHKNVFNLSAMTRLDAEQLIQKVEGVNCVRLYRRADGTIITDDCPVALRRAARAISWTLGSLAMGVLMIITVVAGQLVEKDTDAWSGLRRIEPFATIINWIWPGPTAKPPASECIMGKRDHWKGGNHESAGKGLCFWFHFTSRHNHRSESGRIAPPCLPLWPPSPYSNL